MDYRHEEWGVDVTVGCSQKGLMLPPGLGFNAVSRRAVDASRSNTLPRSYWSWTEMLAANKDGFFPYTPATNLFFGLKKGLELLLEEGLDNVFARHARHAEATRRAVRAWDLELQCLDEREYSGSLTAVRVPDGHNADALPQGHPGEIQHVAGKWSRQGGGQGLPHRSPGRLQRPRPSSPPSPASQTGPSLAGVPHKPAGVAAAMAYFTETAKGHAVT